MTRRLIVRPEAEADINRAAIWYEDRDTGLGNEVLSEIRETIRRALENPEAFTRLKRTQTFIGFWYIDSLIAYSTFWVTKH